jgi:hypothetical protein
MAALTPSQALVGRLSVSATVATTAGPDTVSNAALLAVCSERGPLYSFLNKQYASAAAVVEAFAAQGGILNASSSAPAPVLAWALDGGKPSIALTSTTNEAVCALRIALSYSAAR